MEKKLILLDTSILIDFYRKKHKENTVWYNLVKQAYTFSVSSVTKFEIYSGATFQQIDYWDKVFAEMMILPFDENVADRAVEINNDLKSKSKQIHIADLFFAATALNSNLLLSTLN